MTDAPVHAATPPDTPDILTKLQRTKLPLWVSLLLLLLLLTSFIWQRVAVGQAQRQAEQVQQQLSQQFAADKTALQTRMSAWVKAQDDEALRRLGLALAWAVRGELIRNNLDQVDQFFNELVKLKQVDMVLLADPAGKILVASDKKHQGGEFTAVYPAELLDQVVTTVLPGRDGKRWLVIPVMGLNSRLGTVVLSSAPPAAVTLP